MKPSTRDPSPGHRKQGGATSQVSAPTGPMDSRPLSLPPLPETIEGIAPEMPSEPTIDTFEPQLAPQSWFPHFRVRTLRTGCYLMRYTPHHPLLFSLQHYDGTLRVDREGHNTTASGDLYLHRLLPWPQPVLPFPFPTTVEPNPAAGIPIFPRSRYRYYVRVTKILEWITFSNGFELGFELHRFTAPGNWILEGAFKANMRWMTAPAGYPSPSNYLSGTVFNSTGAAMGTLTIGWVSPFLRRAVVEIDRVPASELPADNGAGVDWRSIYEQVGWDVTVVPSDADVEEASGESWSNAEMHEAMLARRDASNLDVEWRYHVLCTRRLDATSRGIMYDAGATDSNNVPREGCGISSHWTIPNTPMWGTVRGMRFGTASSPYFRTAVHETGHAMGLYHNTVDMGIMNTTDVIAAGAVPPVQFPNNVRWAFANDDQKRLRHLPDMWVRPGGVAFGFGYGAAPISADDSVVEVNGLTLDVEPLLEAVPMGAPVRIQFKLTNTSDQPLAVPKSLSLKYGCVRGTVVDPSGTPRRFLPLVRCLEEAEVVELAPGSSMEHAVTLLRGPEGALFPSPGAYRVAIEVRWEIGGLQLAVQGEGTVMVTPPVDDRHAAAALRILSTPDAVVTLALGGDHLTEGVAAIQAGLDNDVLRPHYAVVEAKRLGRRFGKRKADIPAASRLLDENAVASHAELKSIAALLEYAAGAPSDAKAELGQRILRRAKAAGIADEVAAMVKTS